MKKEFPMASIITQGWSGVKMKLHGKFCIDYPGVIMLYFPSPDAQLLHHIGASGAGNALVKKKPLKVRPMGYRAWFQCINDKCNEQYPLNKIVYRCKTCDSLLEVKHDMKALAQRSALAWMKFFEDRYKSTQWPYGSGIWGKKEWVLPQIADENIVSL